MQKKCASIIAKHLEPWNPSWPEETEKPKRHYQWFKPQEPLQIEEQA